jgi:DNA polymerase-3 subunit epsilon
LCKRFRIDNSRRKFHTALIDCELLSKVYINLTDQKEPKLNFQAEEINNSNSLKKIDYCKKVVQPTKDELENYKIFMRKSLKKNL